MECSYDAEAASGLAEHSEQYDEAELFGSHSWTSPEALDALSQDCLEQLDILFRQSCAPEETAAILLEPVLGEGGYYAAPPAFLRGLKERCERHGILLILDEVQTGFGRTGSMFALDHYAPKEGESPLIPDIMVSDTPPMQSSIHLFIHSLIPSIRPSAFSCVRVWIPFPFPSPLSLGSGSGEGACIRSSSLSDRDSY